MGKEWSSCLRLILIRNAGWVVKTTGQTADTDHNGIGSWPKLCALNQRKQPEGSSCFSSAAAFAGLVNASARPSRRVRRHVERKPSSEKRWPRTNHNNQDAGTWPDQSLSFQWSSSCRRLDPVFLNEKILFLKIASHCTGFCLLFLFACF